MKRYFKVLDQDRIGEDIDYLPVSWTRIPKSIVEKNPSLIRSSLAIFPDFLIRELSVVYLKELSEKEISDQDEILESELYEDIYFIV